jgi:uncharacterized Rossmann fold enzyme
MEFDLWNTYYRSICSDLGIDSQTDYDSAFSLNSLIEKRKPVWIQENLTDRVYVVGNGPDVEHVLKDLNMNGTVFVADSAIEKYLGIKGYPDYLFSDLDGPLKLIKKCSDENVRLVVHAHGDNRKNIESYVPSLKVHMGTTQNRPVGVLRNFGGFTDGDRAAFFAHFFGAPEIILVGFDFSRPSVKEGSDYYRKAKKLKWAEILLSKLALMRGTSLKPGQVIRI